MEQNAGREPEIHSVDDVFAAGRARADAGGREVLLPGGMGIALIEQLEQELNEEGLGHAVAEEVADASRSAMDDVATRLDAARARLRSAIERPS